MTRALIALALTFALGLVGTVPPPGSPGVLATAIPHTSEHARRKPLVVVRKVVIRQDVDLYGTIKVIDRDDMSHPSIAFDRSSGDSVPVAYGGDAPLRGNGRPAQHVSIEVDLWDHYRFLPDRHIAAKTIDVDQFDDGVNEVNVGAARITFSRQQSWQKTDVQNIVLTSSRYSHADIYGDIYVREIYTDQRAERVVSIFTLFHRSSGNSTRVDRGANIWNGSLPVYTDTDQPTIVVDLWDHYTWRSDDHLAVGKAQVPIQYLPPPCERHQVVEGTGKIEVVSVSTRSSEDPAAAGWDGIAHRSSDDPAYWTPARMEAAKGADDPSSFPVHGHGNGAGDGLSIRPAVNPLVGKLFYRQDGQDRFCSGVSVPSEQRNQVETAGHCILNEGPAAHWSSNIVFVPGYDASAPPQAREPYGIWPFLTALVLEGWAVSRDPRYDQAILRVAPHAGTNLADVVGTARIIFDQNPTQPMTLAQGYSEVGGPVVRSNGELYECTGGAVSSGGFSILSSCALRHGSSGGPMLICDPYAPHSLAVYAVIRGGSATDPRYIYAFPHSLLFRDLMMNLGHVLLPSGGHTSSRT